ncbi:MAG: DUF2851 family protein [Flavobacteriales bacterium]|nr:DUF2851 family protein [Flavobacteriales bacterium]
MDMQMARAEEAAIRETDQLLDPAFPYGEDLLQFIWEQGLYDAKDLRTTDGAPLEVLHAGRVQLNSGPDLRDAQVRIGGQRWAGNVEVHLRTSDWNAHGHQRDPAYDNVVLHTVYLHDAEVHTASGRCPPTVELRERINADNLHLHQSLMESRMPVPCAPRLGDVDGTRIRLWLERLLVERLERKVAQVEEVYSRTGNDPGETLHHMLLRGLGGQVNAEAFSMLAHALPLKLLLKYRDDRRRTEALLFGQAGFLEAEQQEAYPAELRQEYQWLRALHGLRPVPASAWKYGRLRPPNFPTVRLAQWAELIIRSGTTYDRLLAHDDPRVVHQLLDVEAAGYWRDHFTFGKPSSARPGLKRLGKAAVDGLLINSIVPYLFAMGRIRGHAPWTDRAITLLERLPAEENSITRMWRGIGVEAANAGQSQALIELKDRWCTERKCLRCAIGTCLHKQTGT